jgi:hypothetical protein
MTRNEAEPTPDVDIAISQFLEIHMPQCVLHASFMWGPMLAENVVAVVSREPAQK